MGGGSSKSQEEVNVNNNQQSAVISPSKNETSLSLIAGCLLILVVGLTLYVIWKLLRREVDIRAEKQIGRSKLKSNISTIV